MAYKVFSTRNIHSAKYFDVVEEAIELPNGSRSTRTLVIHPGAVVIVPKESDGKLLLVRQYRHALKSTILEFPAGTLERGEDPAACAQRELIEETGKSAADWIALGTLYPAPGFCNEIQHLYLASHLSPAIAAMDDDEIIEPTSMTIAQVEEAIRAGDLNDGKSLAAFCRARALSLI